MISTVSGRVSVVMPCFNDEPAHLQQAIDSVLRQSYCDVEIVVVDDGSTSETTIAALDELPATIVTIRTDNNGPAAARNTAITNSSGEFVLPLDADDWISPDFIASTMAVTTDAAVEIAYPDVQEFGASNRLKQPPANVTLADMSNGNKIAACALFRRDSWGAVGGYDESMKRGFEDYELWVRLLRGGGVARKAAGSVLHYRQKQSSRRLRDLAAGDAMTVTRRQMIANNPDHLDTLLVAAWAQLDVLEGEVAKAWNDPLQARRWLRRIKPLLRRA